jgi:hypothetical protein
MGFSSLVKKPRGENCGAYTKYLRRAKDVSSGRDKRLAQLLKAASQDYCYTLKS